MAINIENYEDFKEKVLNSEKTVVVDFWATWCGPCRMFKPIFEETSELEEYSDVVFAKVDVDEVPEVGPEFGIRSIPTIMMFKDGEMIAQKQGASSPDQFKDFINENKEKKEEAKDE